VSLHAGTHCSAGIDASDTRFFRSDSREQRASNRGIFRSRKILTRNPKYPRSILPPSPSVQGRYRFTISTFQTTSHRGTGCSSICLWKEMVYKYLEESTLSTLD